MEVEFSPARYEPMVHLLDDRELTYLESQPGFLPQMGKKFRHERRRIFRLYLRELASDFRHLHQRARIVAARLPAEHSPLLRILFRQHLRFRYEMFAIEMKLRFGIGSIQVRGLIDVLANMQAEIGRAAAPAAI